MVRRWCWEYAATGRAVFRETGSLYLPFKEAQIERDILIKAVSIFSRYDSKYSGT
jgi:transposase